MILYDPRAHLHLLEYGIMIPVHDSRVYRTLQALGATDLARPPACLETTITETISRSDVERVHAPTYTRRFFGEDAELEALALAGFELVNPDGSYHRYDPAQARRPISDLRNPILMGCAGTWQTCLRALDRGFAYFLGGGNHHAHADHGWGFCLLNEIVIAARKLLAEGKAGRIWIIDIDAHKGDGTAALCRDDPDIATFSIHMAEGWPLDPETRARLPASAPCFGPSTVDVEMRPGEDSRYLAALAEGLARFERIAGPADLAIVVDGADPYEHDELPSTATMRLSLDQCFERDRLVLDFLRQRRMPSAWLMAGGYGQRSWEVYSRFLASVLAES